MGRWRLLEPAEHREQSVDVVGLDRVDGVVDRRDHARGLALYDHVRLEEPAGYGVG